MLKPNVIYDANIWNKLSYDDLNHWINEAKNYLVNDTAVELYAAGLKYKDNVEFRRKLSLAFKDDWGLNDKFTLVLLEVPWKHPTVYTNSVHTLNPKNDALTCSLYHYWLRYAISPAIVIDPLICGNSALTMILNNKENPQSLMNVEADKNRIRQEMLIRIRPMFEKSIINIKTLVGTWKKRDDSIKNGTFKLADYREILWALVKIVATRETAIILTADYDLVDIQNNIYSSIIDQYVIQSILLQKVKEGFDISDVPKSIRIDKHEIEARAEDVFEKIHSSTEYAAMVVMLYSDKDGKVYPFENRFPGWLLRFLRDYRGVTNCLSLPYNPKNPYCIRYIWYQETLSSEDGVRFDIWLDVGNDKKLPPITPHILKKMSKEELEKEKNKAVFPMMCKPLCQYERNEYNSPESLSSFIIDDPNK